VQLRVVEKQLFDIVLLNVASAITAASISTHSALVVVDVVDAIADVLAAVDTLVPTHMFTSTNSARAEEKTAIIVF
jgi:hypothetical protein